MPRIDDRLFAMVAYVYPNLLSAEGDLAGGGTAFLVGIEADGYPISLLVTARHVLYKRQPLYRHPAPAVRFPNTSLPPREVTNWIESKADDLAVAVITDVPAHAVTLSLEDLLTEEMIDRLHVGAGDEVFYLGRFQPLPKEPSVTTVRFGSISNPEPVEVPHDTFPGLRQVAYLVESRSRQGLSGSPVILMTTRDPDPEEESQEARPIVTTIEGWNEYLLGVTFAYYPEMQEFRARTRTATAGAGFDLITDLNAGMICVVPAWRLRDLMENDGRVRRHIEQAARRAGRQRRHPSKL